MKILFTGFTSRTVGSDRNVYDYLSNVDVLAHALTLAGHEVDRRQVSLVGDPCVGEDYDCAVVGVAACNGLSSRFKLGALWTLSQFDKRAAIFPSDGRNVAIFPASVLSETPSATHSCGPYPAYLLGAGMKEKNNVVEAEIGAVVEEQTGVFLDVLNKLPQTGKLQCAWPVLVPTFSWGRASVYSRAFGAPATIWDPTNAAIPMQFGPTELGSDGRIDFATAGIMSTFRPPRERSWVLSTLQDQSAWLKKQKCGWPVLNIGNKRMARTGDGLEYVNEKALVRDYYRRYWGHLAFGYPLADGGWWRMRYVHAALAGCVTCSDPVDAQLMPEAFRHSRVMLERWSDDKLAEVALAQHEQLQAAAWPVTRILEVLDTFVRGLE